MKTRMLIHVAACVCGLFLTVQSGFAQGSLTPPGAPAPTMKSLDQVEARTIVNAANTPGNSTNLLIISQPGSYYLTTNVTGVIGKNGIAITANDVTLDLNGFALLSGYGTLVAIFIPNAQTNITVRNGTINGWGITVMLYNAGVAQISTNSVNMVFERLNVSANFGGIELKGSGIVRDCNAGENIFDGIDCFGAGAVSGCIANDNDAIGIDCNNGLVSDCTANNNGNNGISSASSVSVFNCTANSNNFWGMACGPGGIVTGCSAANNGLGGSGFGGIYMGNNCVVKDCVVNANNGNGISVNNSTLIDRCTVIGNSTNGITTGVVCKVADCVVATSTGYGIVASDHAQVIGCHVNGNASGGVKISNYSLVRDNMVDFQEGTTTTPGITASGSRNRIEGNNITRCGIGLQATSTANLILRNSVSGSTGVAYSIASGNSVGAIVVPTSSGTINGSSGGGIGSTDPTANFAY